MKVFLSRTVRQWLFGSLGVGVATGVLAFVLLGQLDASLLDEEVPVPVRLVSAVCGWTYFVCWSVSFWPQVLLNYQRKAVDGLSVDFLALNVCGFACYAVYNCLLYLPTYVRAAYIERHEEPPGVHANDVVFAGHALVLTLASSVQAVAYSRSRVCLTPATILFLAASFVAITASLPSVRPNPFLLLDVLSAVKVGSSAAKFLPQLLLNRERRSTAGFSLAQVVLDAAGSVLSVAQLLLDAVVLQSSRVVRGNPAKLGLGLVSLSYDAVLFHQHLWYDDEDVDEPLL